MTTDFYVISGTTVPNNYTWDLGNPFETESATVTANSTFSYISGYAPGLKVVFANTSQQDLAPENSTQFIEYAWNFGDYYNDLTNNVSLSCVAPVQHIYLMPGKYTVTLTFTQSFTRPLIDTDPDLCRDKYDVNWYWDNLNFGTTTQQQKINDWNSTKCNSNFAKWWDFELACFQKHCRFWSWEETKSSKLSRATWEQTQATNTLQKRWYFEANDTICATPTIYKDTVQTQIQTKTKEYIVEVKEILPTANIYTVTNPVTGVSELTVQLTPRATLCGSFPIDRLDWDFGDGTPIKTVTRYANNNLDTNLVSNNNYIGDSSDPRNYDVLHTYVRTSVDTYPIFYPSLTAYSANTGSQDACSTTVGPIQIPTAPSVAPSLVKVKNTNNGRLLAMEYNNSITFLTTSPLVSNISSLNTNINTPKNRVVNSIDSQALYNGNNGEEYPPYIDLNCAGYETVPNIYGLVLEENTDLNVATLPLSSSALSAIVQETEDYILV